LLKYNQIGDEGCKALAAAQGKEGAAPRLEKLYLFCNKIGDEGWPPPSRRGPPRA